MQKISILKFSDALSQLPNELPKILRYLNPATAPIYEHMEKAYLTAFSWNFDFDISDGILTIASDRYSFYTDSAWLHNLLNGTKEQLNLVQRQVANDGGKIITAYQFEFPYFLAYGDFVVELNNFRYIDLVWCKYAMYTPFSFGSQPDEWANILNSSFDGLTSALKKVKAYYSLKNNYELWDYNKFASYVEFLKNDVPFIEYDGIVGNITETEETVAIEIKQNIPHERFPWVLSEQTVVQEIPKMGGYELNIQVGQEVCYGTAIYMVYYPEEVALL